MTSIQEATESGLREFVTQHRANPSTRLTVVQFDTTDPYDVVCLNAPITEVGPIALVPRGGTPLCDAWCKTIDKTGQRLAALPEADRPSKVIFVVITDGQENASRFQRRADVHQRVTRQTNDYKWEFVYLGANQDAIQEASYYGIQGLRALQFDATPGLTKSSFGHLATNTLSYTQSGDTNSMNWSDEQRADTVSKEKK
jgi:hypothetical protein